MPLSTDGVLADDQNGGEKISVTTPVSSSPVEPPRHSVTSLLAPLKVHNFCLLLGGQTVSNLGDVFYAVALPWLVLTRGNGAQELGLVLGAYGISRICTTALGGMLSDRLGPRRIMLFADVTRALLVAFLTVLVFWRGYLPLWQLCAITIPLGAFTGLFWPANYAIMPKLLPDDALQSGNAINISLRQLTSLVGFGIAGVVISRLQLGTALAVDVFSFVVSAITLAFMRSERKASFADLPFVPPPFPMKGEPSTEEESASTDQSSMTFWQLVKSSHLFQLALLLVAITGLTFDGMMQVALPTLAHGAFATGASGYGVMLAAFSGGALVGGVIAGSLGHLRRRSIVALVLLLLEAGAVTCVPFTGGVLGAALALAGAGFTNGLAGILLLTLVQQLLPRHLQGRIMAAIILANDGLYPLSVVLAGAVTTRWGAMAMFPLTGIAILIAAIFGLLQRESREV